MEVSNDSFVSFRFLALSDVSPGQNACYAIVSIAKAFSLAQQHHCRETDLRALPTERKQKAVSISWERHHSSHEFSAVCTGSANRSIPRAVLCACIRIRPIVVRSTQLIAWCRYCLEDETLNGLCRLLSEDKAVSAVALACSYFCAVAKGQHVIGREFAYVSQTLWNRQAFLHAARGMFERATK